MSKNFVFFNITANTAYSTPVYIHSHVRGFTHNSTVMYETEFKKMIDDLEDVYHTTVFELGRAMTYLKAQTNNLISMGYPTINGNPGGLTQKFIEINKKVTSVYKTALNLQKYLYKKIDSQIMGQFISSIQDPNNAKVKIEDILKDITGDVSSEMATLIATRLSQVMALKKYNITNILSPEAILQTTADVIVKIFSKKRGSGLKTSFIQDMNRAVKVGRFALSEYKELLEEVKKYSPILNNPTSNNINDPNLAAVMKKVFDLSSSESILQRLGYLEEILTTFMGQNAINEKGIIKYPTEANIAKIDPSTQSITIESKNVGSKKNIAGGDQFTTDVINVLKESNYVFGTSVKLNPVRLVKSVHLTANELKDYNNIINKYNQQAIAYYLTNYAILSKMAYPSNDSKERWEYDTTQNMPAPRGKTYPSIFNGFTNAINRSLVIDAFVKTVVGPLLMRDFDTSSSLFQTAASAQGVPLILQTSVGQYWTYSLLDSAYRIVKSGAELSSFATVSNGLTEFQKKINNASQISAEFIQLFARKVDYSKKNPVSLSYSGDRYADIYSDTAVSSLMSSIYKQLWGPLGTDLKAILASTKINIRFDYSNL